MPISVILFIVTIVVIALGFGAVMARSDQRFKLERERVRAQGGGNSLATSELKALIQEAVEEAIAPVDARLELMERSLRQLPDHGSERAVSKPEPPVQD